MTAAISSSRRWRARAIRRSRRAIPTSISTSSSASSPAIYGETVRGLDLRMSRRGGRIRSFTLNAKIGRDTPLIGEMRTRVNNGSRCSISRPAMPARCSASPTSISAWSAARCGSAWIRRPRTARAQDGIINIRGFSIRGESTLDRVVSNAPNARRPEQQRRVLAGARRLHPGAGPHDGPRRRGARADDRRDRRRQHRLCPRPCADARHVRAALRPQQHVRPDSDRRPVPRRRQQRGHVRHHLRGDGPPAIRARWSIRSRRSRRACCASSSNSATRRIATAPSPSRRSAKSQIRLEQDVALRAERELDHAFRRQRRLRSAPSSRR